jgi:hypothetical protein
MEKQVFAWKNRYLIRCILLQQKYIVSWLFSQLIIYNVIDIFNRITLNNKTAILYV